MKLSELPRIEPGCRAPCESLTQVSHVVLSDDANPLGILRGGRLMEWIDIASEITAQKHAHQVAVTAGILGISFMKSVQIGEIVTIQAQVTRSFNTSMEVYIQVWSEQVPQMKKALTNDAFFTMVAVNNTGCPIAVPVLIPESEFEWDLYNNALVRKKSATVLFKNFKTHERHIGN